jgi:hypothetical protein
MLSPGLVKCTGSYILKNDEINNLNTKQFDSKNKLLLFFHDSRVNNTSRTAEIIQW